MCRHPDSLRTKIASAAYLAAYAEADRWRPGPEIDQHCLYYIQRTLSEPKRWQVYLISRSYRAGWRDKARNKPCQPFPAC